MPKIVGNPVGVPNPKTNWEQTNETKADVILNKPTKLSQFENDVPYAKQGEVDETVIQLWSDMSNAYMLLNDKADASEIPTKVSELENDSGYQTYDEVQQMCDGYYSSLYSELTYKADADHSHDELPSLQMQIDNLYNDKADATYVVTYMDESSFTFRFESMNNYEARLFQVCPSISFIFGNGVYSDTYTSGLSFDSGETPTAIDYTDSGIINWVGTDCTNVDGLSIFQPTANTHYDIVFYFNGSQFIGLVNGFVPASGNVVSE